MPCGCSGCPKLSLLAVQWPKENSGCSSVCSNGVAPGVKQPLLRGLVCPNDALWTLSNGSYTSRALQQTYVLLFLLFCTHSWYMLHLLRTLYLSFYVGHYRWHSTANVPQSLLQAALFVARMWYAVPPTNQPNFSCSLQKICLATTPVPVQVSAGIFLPLAQPHLDLCFGTDSSVGSSLVLYPIRTVLAGALPIPSTMPPDACHNFEPSQGYHPCCLKHPPAQCMHAWPDPNGSTVFPNVCIRLYMRACIFPYHH